MYKCTDNGRVVFQDRPCATAGEVITVKPANSPDVATPTHKSVPAPASAAEQFQRLKQDVAQMEFERKKRDLEYAIRDRDHEITLAQQQMEVDMSRLQSKKLLAENSLAGATWESSISQEMEALGQKYRSRIQVATDERAQLRKELDDLVKAGPGVPAAH
ncbi:MAG: DUF4124 domain-containing protein [Proteobacteria bacterium]|nr:DUF4124 domain-containing protein [Pseudomonadota bacterium]